MANIQSQEVSYSADGVEMKGYIAWDVDLAGKRPGVLVVHDAWGHDHYVRRRADMLAALGYTAMAVDMYGSGKTASNPSEVAELLSGLVSDLVTLRARFDAAFACLLDNPQVEAGSMAAIGYCLGGGIVLHMARYGASLKVVASFHGSLPMGVAAEGEGGEVAARIAVYHGEDDVLVASEAVTSFQQEMQKTGADCLFITIPCAIHSFTNPSATGKGEKFGVPLRYNELADRCSWDHMQLVLQSAFKETA